MKTRFFWLGLGLGLLPAIAWWSNYGWPVQSFTSLANWWSKVDGWLWLIGSFPGLIFALPVYREAFRSLHWSWARLLVCQGGIYGVLVLVTPWPSTVLVMPLLVIFALASGLTLGEIRAGNKLYHYPRWWRRLLVVNGIWLWILAGVVYLRGPTLTPSGNVWVLTALTLILLGGTFTMTALLLDREQLEFIPVLFWGLFISWLVAIHTPLFTPSPLVVFEGHSPPSSTNTVVSEQLSKLRQQSLPSPC